MISIRHKYFSRFDGISFKTEPSSQYRHDYTHALGSYRNSPFVTGGYDNYHGLKTEILKNKEWTEMTDYPFAKKKFIEN